MAEFILKDRHGNSRTFDKETFYVRGADGELMPFTHGTGNPVLQPLTITENGTYTAPAGVDGYNPVTVEVDPTKVAIFQETELPESEMVDAFGVFTSRINPAPFVLTVGETYFVKWDGTEYECVAQDGSTIISGAVFIGNASGFGLSGNGEPFIIGGTLNEGILCNFLCLTDTEPTVHTCGIWQKVTQEIKLQDITITENGEYTADDGFDGLGKVTVDVAGSGGLEPGVYYVPYEYPKPSGMCNFRFFKLNGVMYVLANTQGNQSTAKFNVYKFESGAWTKINSTQYSYSLGKNLPKNLHCVELNGKIHIFTNFTPIVHYILDENGLTQHKTVTSQSVYCPFVEDGKLKLTSGVSSYSSYVWDEETDTWTTDPTAPKEYDIMNYNGDLYYKSGKNVYLRKNGTDTLVCTISGSTGTFKFMKNGYMYGASFGSGMVSLYELNIATGESKMISEMMECEGATFYTPGEDEPILYSSGTSHDYYNFFVNLALSIVRE